MLQVRFASQRNAVKYLQPIFKHLREDTRPCLKYGYIGWFECDSNDSILNEIVTKLYIASGAFLRDRSPLKEKINNDGLRLHV